MSSFCWNASRSLMTIWIISCKFSFSARLKKWTQWRSKRTTFIWFRNEVISINQLCCLSTSNKLTRTKNWFFILIKKTKNSNCESYSKSSLKSLKRMSLKMSFRRTSMMIRQTSRIFSWRSSSLRLWKKKRKKQFSKSKRSSKKNQTKRRQSNRMSSNSKTQVHK
jgi:hypothetical protein